MKCRGCGGKIGKGDKIKVKHGLICRNCFYRLPSKVQENIGNFTLRQIRQFFEVVHPATSTPIIRSGMFGVCKDSIVIKGAEYKLKNISKFGVGFHPSQFGKTSNTVIGTVTIIITIEIKSQQFIIEEEFLPQQITAWYIVDGENIHYRFSYEFERLVMAVQECLGDGVYDMSGYLRRFAVDLYDRNEFMKRMKGKEDGGNREDGKKNASFHTEDGEDKSKLDEARELLGVGMTCTASQLKNARNIRKR